MRRRRLAITLTGAGAATLVVVLGTVLTVDLLSPPGQDEYRAERLRASRAEPSTSLSPAPDGWAPFGRPSLSPWASREQPPPARWEEAYATELVLDQPMLGETVRDAYAEATGRPLSTPLELRVRSLIFRRHGCETHRCLHLFIWFPDGTSLDIGRVIVDLSTQEVRVLPW